MCLHDHTRSLKLVTIMLAQRIKFHHTTLPVTMPVGMQGSSFVLPVVALKDECLPVCHEGDIEWCLSAKQMHGGSFVDEDVDCMADDWSDSGEAKVFINRAFACL